MPDSAISGLAGSADLSPWDDRRGWRSATALVIKLTQLNRVRNLRELSVPPGNRLERLKGDRSGQHSIRINDQFRVCFRWEDGYADEVEVTDYH